MMRRIINAKIKQFMLCYSSPQFRICRSNQNPKDKAKIKVSISQLLWAAPSILPRMDITETSWLRIRFYHISWLAAAICWTVKCILVPRRVLYQCSDSRRMEPLWDWVVPEPRTSTYSARDSRCHRLFYIYVAESSFSENIPHIRNIANQAKLFSHQTGHR